MGHYVVDAHALIWFLTGSERLGPEARSAMSDPESALWLPIIALAEVCWLVERGRTAVPSVEALLSALNRDPRLVLVPLDRAFLETILRLTAITEMHDRQIVATALVLGESGPTPPVRTRDANIVASGAVRVVW